MITLLVVLTALIIVVAIGLLAAGLIAVSPILLIILFLPLIDVVVIRHIFKKKTK